MSDFEQLAERYIATWNETDPTLHRKLVEEVWAPNGRYVDPLAMAEGREAIDATIASVQGQFPDLALPMTEIFNALVPSTDGYITGTHLDPDRPSGDTWRAFLDWNKDSERPSNQFADVGLCSANPPQLSFPSAGTRNVNPDVSRPGTMRPQASLGAQPTDSSRCSDDATTGLK